MARCPRSRIRLAHLHFLVMVCRMGKIGYGYGSEWHLLRYLGYHRELLSGVVAGQIGAISVRWLDTNFSTLNVSLRDDEEWSGIDFVSAPAVQSRWKQFWPGSSSRFQQHWDAVAVVKVGGAEEWLLVEAKSHMGEMASTCGASQSSRRTIEAALSATQQAFGSTTPVEHWLSPYYQYANRLAALHFLNSNGCPARLLNIYFCGEARKGWETCATPQDWHTCLGTVEAHLGLSKSAPLADRIHSLFLDVHPHATTARLPVGQRFKAIP